MMRLRTLLLLAFAPLSIAVTLDCPSQLFAAAECLSALGSDEDVTACQNCLYQGLLDADLSSIECLAFNMAACSPAIGVCVDVCAVEACSQPIYDWIECMAENASCEIGCQTIYDLIASMNDYQTLRNLLDTVSLGGTLERRIPLTVLIVDNNIWDSQIVPLEELEQVLQNHVFEGYLTCDDFRLRSGTTIASVNGNEWNVEVQQDLSICLSSLDATVTACITECDLPAYNGLVHKLDNVLTQEAFETRSPTTALPPAAVPPSTAAQPVPTASPVAMAVPSAATEGNMTIYEIAAARPNYSGHLQVVTAASIDDFILDNDQLTALFAPNTAWAAAFAQDTYDQRQLVVLSLNHLFLLPDGPATCADLRGLASTNSSVESISQIEWPLSVNDQGFPCFELSGTTRSCITRCDVMANNGIVHFVDEILVKPNQLTEPPTGAPVLPTPAPTEALPTISPTTTVPTGTTTLPGSTPLPTPPANVPTSTPASSVLTPTMVPAPSSTVVTVPSDSPATRQPSPIASPTVSTPTNVFSDAPSDVPSDMPSTMPSMAPSLAPSMTNETASSSTATWSVGLALGWLMISALVC